jgi:hypothetical protein
MPGSPPSQAEMTGSLRRSITHFEALGLDWGSAVIATANLYGVRLMDVIVVAPRVEKSVAEVERS